MTVIVLAICLALALPLTALMVIEHQKLKSEIRAEVRELRKIKKDFATERGKHERANPTVDQPPAQ